MRKVWLTFAAVAVLTAATAIPAFAAVPQGKNCPDSWNWSWMTGSAITQPTVPSIPGNCQPVVSSDNTGNNSLSSNLNLSEIFSQVQKQFTNICNNISGTSNCPNQSANCNQ